jgi:uncharacterized membrane protein
MDGFSAAFIEAASWEGPLPHPAHLAQYEAACPGAAQEIIDLLKRQAAHRQELELMVVRGNDRRASHGLYIAGFLATLVVVAGVWLISTGRGVAGLALLLSEMAVLAGVFVYGKSDQRRERLEKAKLMAGPSQPELPFPPS